jgi:5'-methylthioadenosine phosphorylase
MSKASIGVIGGSGLYAMEGMKVLEEVKSSTPWGEPSDKIVIGEVEGIAIAFLPRHGQGHRIMPTEVNSRANICGLKMLGVEKIIAFSAVGSLKEEIKPLDFAIPDQLIDRTRSRPSTFFGGGVVGHAAFADPFCNPMGEILYEESCKLGITTHKNETSVCMEGPLFSTRAESNLYRSWGAGLINMTALPEAKLAREAEICYSIVSMATDYDCWKEEESDVDIQMVIENINKNAENARRLLKAAAPKIASGTWDCACPEASKYAIITAPEVRDPEKAKALKVLLPRYFD